MNMIAKAASDFIRNEDGASATEYAVLIVLIILVALVAIALLGNQVSKAFQKFSDEIRPHTT